MNLKLKVGAHTLELKIKGLTNSVLSGTMIALVLKLIKLFFQYSILCPLAYQSHTEISIRKSTTPCTEKYHQVPILTLLTQNSVLTMGTGEICHFTDHGIHSMEIHLAVDTLDTGRSIR